MSSRLYAPLSILGIHGGSPLTLDRAIYVLEAYVTRQDMLQAQHDNAFERFESVRTKAAKARWRGKLNEIQREYSRVSMATDALENQIDEYTKALVEPEEPDRQTEWQFGLEYEASRRGGHNVDLNVNIRRKDGAAFTADDAKRAMRARLSTGAFPEEYEVADVLYRSPDSKSAKGRTFRDGGYDADSLNESFDAVIISTHIADWRVGGIEE